MADIICDTNIWYSIGNGYIKEEEFKDTALAMHWLSVGELSATNKNITNPDFLRNALISVVKENRKLYHYPPLNHIAYLIDEKNTCETNMQSAIASLILQLNNPLKLFEEDSNSIAKKKYHEIKLGSINKINENSLNLKMGIKNKSKFMITDNSLAVREFIANEVNNFFGKIIFDINTFDWKKLELYEGSMKILSKMLISGQTKLTENDLVDIFQLIYVQPGNLFWTRDNKLKKTIKIACLDHYLFEK